MATIPAHLPADVCAVCAGSPHVASLDGHQFISNADAAKVKAR